MALLPLKGDDNSKMRSFHVETIKVKGMDITNIFDLSGKVIANRKLVIKSPAEGIIARVHVIDGEWITRGEKVITFSKDEINNAIKQNLSDIKKWETILEQRQNWKVREKSSEDNAKKNIRDHKVALEQNREFLKNPVVKSDGEGKVVRIKSKGDKVSAGSELAIVVDDYVMKVIIPSEYEVHFFKGMRMEVEFPGKNLKRTGRIGNDGDHMMIFVNNSDLKIRSGMKVVFSVKKRSKDVILVNRRDFKTDVDNIPFVYISDGNKAVKRNIKIEKFKDSAYIVTSGLKYGEMLVSPMIDTNVPEFLINKKREFYTNEIKGDLRVRKKPKIRKENFSFGKKMEYVISTGISFSKPESLMTKNSGIDKSVSQYADIFGLTQSSTGEFKENLAGIPINLMVNYKLSEGLYLKFGGEFAMMNNSSSKIYSVSWPGMTETIDLSLENSITNIMPFVGIEKRFSSFGIYAIVGLNMTSFNHTNITNISDSAGSVESVEEIKASGTGIGINIGLKYMIKLKDKFGIFVKLEYAMHNIGSFSGDKTTTVTDSLGDNYSATDSGSLYLYDLDPYGNGSFGWWDIHNSSPSGNDVSNVSEYSMDMSRIRFMVGFSF